MMKVIVFLFAFLSLAMAGGFLEPTNDIDRAVDPIRSIIYDKSIDSSEKSLKILADSGTILAQESAYNAEFDFWSEVQYLVDFVGNWA